MSELNMNPRDRWNPSACAFEKPLLTLTAIEEMLQKAGGPYGDRKAFRGSSMVVRALWRLMVTTGQTPPRTLKNLKVCGFPVIVDDTCPPGMLYFGEYLPTQKEKP